MACRVKDISINPVIEIIANQGFDGLSEAVTLLINEAMKIERIKHLEAEPYERTASRNGYANGYKPKTIKSRLGELGLSIPQVRDSDFYPSVLERGLRSERALKLALAEMYVQSIAKDLAAWMEDNIPESLTIMQFPETHRKRLRTSNLVERVNKEIRRRTRVASIFPNTDSCLRLVTAVIMEIDEEWQEAPTYLTFKN